jgi:hypothetical protein
MNLPIASTVSIETLPSFGDAARALRKFRKPSYSRAAAQLSGLTVTLRAAKILRELASESLAGCTGVDWLTDGDGQESLMRKTMEAISAIAPLDEETVDIDIQDGQFRLVPAAMGFPMNWDEWQEIVNDPANFIEKEGSMWAFCCALGTGDQEAFENFSSYFDWDLRWPKRAGGTYDKEKLFRGFQRRGLKCFEVAWNIAIYSTGNLYFDYNIYDDNIALPPFDIHGVRKLEAQYKEAQPIQAQYRQALDLFLYRDGVPAALLRIFAHSLAKEEEDRLIRRARSLGEVFRAEQEAMAEDEEDAENDETDPFGVLR